VQKRHLLIALVVCASVALATACKLSEDKAAPIDGPMLTGPSELALALAVSMSPDVLSQDGKSQSVLTVVARGPNGEPRSGVSLRLAMTVGGTTVDYGTLSSKAISTNSAGMASAIYTAPAAPPPTVSNDTTLEIHIEPVGIDYGNTTDRKVSLRLVRPGVIVPPNPLVTASAFFSPQQPREDEVVTFDGSGSTGKIVSYAWTFGDGTTGTGVRPTHAYSIAGTYRVVLTVTDDQGTQASSEPAVVSVIQAADPTAAFSLSPTDPTIADDVHFDGSLSTTPVGTGRTIVSYEWNFGDGSPLATGRLVSHRYTKIGTYSIVLNVRDSSGRRGTASKTVQVK
jgi:PKD repeat protein